MRWMKHRAALPRWPLPWAPIRLPCIGGLGAERTEEQYRTLLAKAGFAVTQIIPTRALMSIIEARPVE